MLKVLFPLLLCYLVLGSNDKSNGKDTDNDNEVEISKETGKESENEKNEKNENGNKNEDEYDDEDDCENEWKVDYIGKSTQFRLINNCASNDTVKFVKIKMSNLLEIKPNGKKETSNAVNSFASQDWDWEDPGCDSDNDCTSNKFVADLNNGAQFNLTTIYNEDESEYDNITYPNATLKFSVDISQWPWISDSNTLRLCMNILTQEKSKDDSSSSSDGNDTDIVNSTLNGFEIDSPTIGLCGDNETDIVVDRSNKQGNSMDICFTFKYCDYDYIGYDPFIYYVGQTSNNNANGGQTTTAQVVSVAVTVVKVFAIGFAIALLVVAIVYGFRYKNKTDDTYGLLENDSQAEVERQVKGQETIA